MSETPEELHKTTIPLPAGHGWTCKEGNSLFVADRGAAAFEIPSGWVVRHDAKGTVSLHDLPPPADSCRIALTVFRLPPVRGGWSALPLSALLERAEELRPRPRLPKPRDQGRGASSSPNAPLTVHTEARPDLELVWADKGCWPDPENGKPIHCRQILARARLVQVLITFDVYEEHRPRFEAAWSDLLKTLRVAVPRDLTGGVGN
jgi:hypothetical protein